MNEDESTFTYISVLAMVFLSVTFFCGWILYMYGQFDVPPKYDGFFKYGTPFGILGLLGFIFRGISRLQR